MLTSINIKWTRKNPTLYVWMEEPLYVWVDGLAITTKCMGQPLYVYGWIGGPYHYRYMCGWESHYMCMCG